MGQGIRTLWWMEARLGHHDTLADEGLDQGIGTLCSGRWRAREGHARSRARGHGEGAERVRGTRRSLLILNPQVPV